MNVIPALVLEIDVVRYFMGISPFIWLWNKLCEESCTSIVPDRKFWAAVVIACERAIQSKLRLEQELFLAQSLMSVGILKCLLFWLVWAF